MRLPPGMSHFQTGQLARFEPSADLLAGVGRPEEAAAGGAGGPCSMDTAWVTGLFFKGRNSVGVFIGLSVPSPRVSCELLAYLRAPVLSSGLNSFEMAVPRLTSPARVGHQLGC